MLRGYDPSAVVNFLRDVARSYRGALNEAEQARAALTDHVCPEPGEPTTVEVVREVPVAGDQYAAMSAEVAEVLRSAYATASEVRERAERDAAAQMAEANRQLEDMERTVAERRASAEAELAELRDRSQKEAEELVESARSESERIREDLAAHRTRVAEQQAELRHKLTTAASILDQLVADVPAVASALTRSDDSGPSTGG